MPILFYRSMLLADDHAPIDALAAALEAEGIAALPVFVPSLRDAGGAGRARAGAARGSAPAALVTATAFAAGEDGGALRPARGAGLPGGAGDDAARGLGGRRARAGAGRPRDARGAAGARRADARGGGVVQGGAAERDERFGLGLQVNRPEPDRVAQVARRIAALLRLAATPPAERRLAVLIPDYPAAAGRTGYAVGLDVPASVLAMLARPARRRLRGRGRPGDAARPDAAAGAASATALALADYRGCAGLPAAARAAVAAAWGGPEADAPDGAFRFRAARFGNVTVALAPDRGRSADRRVDYHDPALPPRHALVAFGLWLREALGCHALVHVGAHGTLEWLPGKTVALSRGLLPRGGRRARCRSSIRSSSPTPARRRRPSGGSRAVTLGHLTPPLVGAGLERGRSASSSGWSTSTRRPTGSTGGGATGWRG